jgi:hypothetical protein
MFGWLHRLGLSRRAPSAPPGGVTGWDLWYHDLFDRESNNVEKRGSDLLTGLYELWNHTLDEGVDEKGNQTFSSFLLEWTGDGTEWYDTGVQPFDNTALAKLKLWSTVIGKDVVCRRMAELHLRAVHQSVHRWAAAKDLLRTIDAMTEPSQLLTDVQERGS